MEQKSMTAFEWNPEFLDALAHRWALLTAGKDGKANTMTVAWGGVGVLWNKPVCFVFVRPQRYTKRYLDCCEQFSLNFLADSEKNHEALIFCGKASGRDTDKFKACGLEKTFIDGCAAIENAETTLICKKLYAQELNADSFLFPEIREKNYPFADYHTVYVGEILQVLKNEEK